MRQLITALCLASAVSLAQQPEAAPKSQKPQVQKVDFTDTTISSVRSVPLGEIYLSPPKAKFKTMIKVRMNFNDKLAESVHEM